MTTKLIPLLVKRYIFTRRKGGFISLISWFSMLGIMLGVATLILVTSLMNGIRQEMLASFIGVDGHIQLVANRTIITDSVALKAQIMPSLPANASVVARIEGQLMATGAVGTAHGVQVVGIHENDIATKPKLLDSMTEQTRAAFARAEGVVIGEGVAQALRLKTGQTITLISPQGHATAFGSVPRIKAYKIIGTFSLGMHALDNGLIFMPYDMAALYFSLNSKGEHPASLLEITLPNMEMATSVSATMQQQLGDAYRVFPWEEIHASVFNALEVQRNVMVIILALIVLVAVFNIISSLIMMVKDKRSDIAILRTMGITKGGIVALFIASGMSIGIIGTLLGMLLGLVGAAKLDMIKSAIEQLTGHEILVANIYFLSTLPTKTDPVEVIIIVSMALVFCLLATIYPAYKAASLDPAEALRNG